MYKNEQRYFKDIFMKCKAYYFFLKKIQNRPNEYLLLHHRSLLLCSDIEHIFGIIICAINNNVPLANLLTFYILFLVGETL